MKSPPPIKAAGNLVTVDGEKAVAALAVFIGDVEAAYGHVTLLLAEHFANGFVIDALDGGEFLGSAGLEERSIVVMS